MIIRTKPIVCVVVPSLATIVIKSVPGKVLGAMEISRLDDALLPDRRRTGFGSKADTVIPAGRVGTANVTFPAYPATGIAVTVKGTEVPSTADL